MRHVALLIPNSPYRTVFCLDPLTSNQVTRMSFLYEACATSSEENDWESTVSIVAPLSTFLESPYGYGDGCETIRV